MISPEELNKVIVGFLIAVNLLSNLLGVLKALDMVRADLPWETPAWAERSPDRDDLFPIMLGMYRRVTPTMADGLVGLGRVYLATGQDDIARQYLLDAVRVAPDTAPHEAAQCARDYGKSELAREIERIAAK